VSDFTLYRDLFAGWSFTNTDVEAVAIEPRDFVYADPPYDVEFTQYAKDGFGWEDQERTAVCFAKHRGPVVLVNQATARVEHLYRKLGYRIEIVDAPRRISCTGDRTPAREIIGTRNL
jgi:DNA adenine methylase